MGRTRITTLQRILKDIRTELLKEAEKIKPEEYNWEPRPGMRTFNGQIQEIGTMEKICIHNLRTQQPLDWGKAIAWSGEDLIAHLKDLEGVRKETNQFLDSLADDKELDKPHQLLPDWRQYWWNQESVATEEMLRWIARHEYYHLGQIISYLWLLGNNPYKP
jgi:uncharacterized damage-inducible protein DinB